MALSLMKEKGIPIDRQRFTWRELAGVPVSKLNIDAFTRVRIILMNGVESDSVRLSHIMQRINAPLRAPLAEIRRVEHHQQTMVNWLLPADQSPLETTIGYEQVAIEVTAHFAQHEPDQYLAQTFRFGLLEDFDHLYRFAALLDRIEGKDANNILQSYTDVIPGRPTEVEHRSPLDDLRTPYDRKRAQPLSKLNVLTLVAGEYQTHDYYMHIGPLYADPVARMTFAEIASIEEQHVTQYGSLIDPEESLIEKWLLHEAMEVWNYWSCMQQETDSHVKAIWERFLNYELGHLQAAMAAFQTYEKRDPAEVLPQTLPDPIRYESHRQFVRDTLKNEVDLRADGVRYVPSAQEPKRSLEYRQQLNSQGSPTTIAAGGYQWKPGGELIEVARSLASTPSPLSERSLH